MKDLPTTKFKTVLIDPPWPLTGNNFIKTPYPTMSITSIAALPIRKLTEKDCYVFLWTTNSMMEEAFGLLRLWKLKFVQTITWCKPYGLGRPPFTATEHCLMARCGQPARPFTETTKKELANHEGIWEKQQRIDNWFQTYEKLAHSQKPHAMYELIENVSDGPYLEMFARNTRPNWTSWGNEI